MYICKYCGKECKNKMSKTKHQQYCELNENRLISNIKFYNNRGHLGHNQYTKAKRLGILILGPSLETRNKISNSHKGKIYSLERKQNIKEYMKKAVLNYPDSYSASNVSGRTKSFEYIDSFGNKTKLKGNWELIVANFFENNNIKWTNKITGFEYEWNGSKHIYFPDFYLPEYDLYVEVKGYQRDRDLEKWKVVKNLKVIKYEEINRIKKNTFSL